jgi:hypothetical protein
MPLCATAIATATGSKSDTSDVLVWIAVLAVTAVVGVIVITVIRRHFRSSENSGPVGFTLHDLRQLRDKGELTKEEYERAKAIMLDRFGTKPDNKEPD